MEKQRADVRPPVHILASESELVTGLALRVEHENPLIAAMLLEEIERAELHDERSLPRDAITLGSKVTFVDHNTLLMRDVELVLPINANIAEGRISILTPMGAALYGLREGSVIDWPDRKGDVRKIRITRVSQPGPQSQVSACN